MKVIDLYNKIANGEEVPEKIKVDDKYYYYDETDYAEFYRYRTILEDDVLTDYVNLNDEVEIIEEDKKIEKIDYNRNTNFRNIADKINEIIDEVNKMKEGK